MWIWNIRMYEDGVWFWKLRGAIFAPSTQDRKLAKFSWEIFFLVHLKSFGKDNRSLRRELLLNLLPKASLERCPCPSMPPGTIGAKGQVHLVYQIPSKQNWLLSCSFFVSPEKPRIQCLLSLSLKPSGLSRMGPSYPGSSLAWWSFSWLIGLSWTPSQLCPLTLPAPLCLLP